MTVHASSPLGAGGQIVEGLRRVGSFISAHQLVRRYLRNELLLPRYEVHLGRLLTSSSSHEWPMIIVSKRKSLLKVIIERIIVWLLLIVLVLFEKLVV